MTPDPPHNNKNNNMYSSKPATNKNTPKGKKNIDKGLSFYLKKIFQLLQSAFEIQFVMFFSIKEKNKRWQNLKCIISPGLSFVSIKLSSIL